MQKEQFFEDQPILVSDLQLAQSSKESAIEERQLDLLDPGVIINSQLAGEAAALQVTQGPNAGLFVTVNTGVAVAPTAERIIIPSVITYNASAPTTISDNGIGGTVLTPQSSGSQNIPVADNAINWIWVGYLETTDATVFTISEANNSRLFVKHNDGYIIQVTQNSNNPGLTIPVPNGGYVLVAQVTCASGVVTLINTTSFLQPATFGPTPIPGSPYTLSLAGSILPNLPPDLDRPNSIPVIAGFTYVTTAPLPTQFSVNFATGVMQFNAADTGTTITATFEVLNVCKQNCVTTGSTVGAQLHLNQKTLVYALGSEVTLTQHVNAYGSGTVTPNNPHGVGPADIGLAGINELGSVLADQGIVTATGNASSLTSSLSPTAVFQALPPSANLVTIAPLIASEFVNLNGTVISATNIPSTTTFNFINPNTLAPLPAGTYFFYIDPVLLTVQKATSVPAGAFPIASIAWNGSTVVLPLTDLRVFGVIGKNNLRLEVLLGLATGSATDNRTSYLFNAKLVGSTVVVSPGFAYTGLGGLTLTGIKDGTPFTINFPAVPANPSVAEVISLFQAVGVIGVLTPDNQLKLLSPISLTINSSSAATILGFTGVATAGTSISGATPGTTAAPSGLTFNVNINGDGAQGVTIAASNTTGVAVAAAMQAAIEALTAFIPSNQAAISATTVSYAGVGYGLLASSTITNTGFTVINGDVDLYPGSSVTGFPPGTFSGTLNVANATAQSAQATAQANFNAGQTAGLAGTTIPSNLNGQTLTPGAYKFASGMASLATSGPGTLTLNGAGNYVIYTASTLTVGAGGVGTISLTGGATAANVLWVVGSSATFNGPNSFAGNVIANTNISFTGAAGGGYLGSMGALTGAISFASAQTVTGGTSGAAEYIITSGSTGINSSVVVQGAGASTLLLGIANGGTEVRGSGGSVDSGNIKEIRIIGSTSSTGVSGQIIPAEIDLIYSGAGDLIQTVAFMGNDILTTDIIYNPDGSINSIQESVNF